MTIMMEMAGIFCIIEVFFMQTFLFVGMCQFSASFATDLGMNLHRLGEKIANEDGKLDSIKQLEYKTKFIELIRFQSDSKM